MAILAPADVPSILKLRSEPMKKYVLTQLGHPVTEVEMTEGEVNELLGYWSTHVAGLINYDYISLRRALVDYGYLERSSDGGTYVLSPSGPGNWEFEAAIDEIDLEATLETAKEEIEARKRAYLEKAKGKE